MRGRKSKTDACALPLRVEVRNNLMCITLPKFVRQEPNNSVYLASYCVAYLSDYN